jgi:hypothetical protein
LVDGRKLFSWQQEKFLLQRLQQNVEFLIFNGVIVISRSQVESLEKCVDSEGGEFVVLDSRIFYVKD